MRKALFITLGVLLNGITLCSAQTGPSIDWRTGRGGPFSDVANSIVATEDGGSVFAGELSSSDGTDAWVLKLDASGNVEWEHEYGGSGTDNAQSIVSVGSSGYLFVGYSDSDDGQVAGHHGGGDYWVVRLNETGAIEWQRCLGGSGNDIAYAVHTTADGGYIITGDSGSDDGDVMAAHGGTELWLIKLNSTGDIQWEHALGGTGLESGFSVVETLDGGFVTVGYTTSTDGDIASGNQGIFDYWVVKVTGTGDLVWERTFGGSGIDFAMSVCESASDGSLLIVGESTSQDGDIVSPIGDFDTWVVALDPSGGDLWMRSYGGNGADRPRSSLAYSNGWLITGTTTSNDGDISANLGGADCWLLRIDENGSIIWSETYGAIGDDAAMDAVVSTVGSILFAGSSNSMGWTSSPSAGTDAIVVHLDPDDVAILENAPIPIPLLFPVPATTVGHLE